MTRCAECHHRILCQNVLLSHAGQNLFGVQLSGKREQRVSQPRDVLTPFPFTPIMPVFSLSRVTPPYDDFITERGVLVKWHPICSDPRRYKKVNLPGRTLIKTCACERRGRWEHTGRHRPRPRLAVSVGNNVAPAALTQSRPCQPPAQRQTHLIPANLLAVLQTEKETERWGESDDARRCAWLELFLLTAQPWSRGDEY